MEFLVAHAEVLGQAFAESFVLMRKKINTSVRRGAELTFGFGLQCEVEYFLNAMFR